MATMLAIVMRNAKLNPRSRETHVVHTNPLIALASNLPYAKTRAKVCPILEEQMAVVDNPKVSGVSFLSIVKTGEPPTNSTSPEISANDTRAETRFENPRVPGPINHVDPEVDQQLKMAIISHLSYNNVDLNRMTIQVHDREVTLTGFVKNETTRKRVEDITGVLPGILSVVNQLRVFPEIAMNNAS